MKVGNLKRLARKLRERQGSIARITSEQSEYLIALMADPRRIKLPEVYRLYIRRAWKQRWKWYSQSAIRKYLNQPHIVDQWKYERYGCGEIKQKLNQ